MGLLVSMTHAAQNLWNLWNRYHPVFVPLSCSSSHLPSGAK